MRNWLIFFPLVLAACAQPPSPAVATADQFPMAGGTNPIKVIAILPGGGVLADAMGAELAKRGFVIHPASSTASMVTGVDFKAVAESYIPKRENPAAVINLKNQLLAKGVDAFLVVARPQDFTPRQFRDAPYFQSASIHLYSTWEVANFFSSYGWSNGDKDRAKSPEEAAAAIVTNMARRSSP
jgi:hypothetical protein